MAIRPIIEIDEALCDGCGDCVTACAEGAIQIIDGKARLVSDVYCDGLGACLGHCHTGALTVVERDCEAFDEVAVEERLASLGAAHVPQARFPSMPIVGVGQATGGCPGSAQRSFSPRPGAVEGGEEAPSQLGHWPVQLHLVNPGAPYYRGRDVLLAADCVAYAVGGFHKRFLQGRSLAIACPKLDSNQEVYLAKLIQMIDGAEIASLTVMVMEVPCCRGLVNLAEEAIRRSRRKLPVQLLVVGVQGGVVQD